MQIGGYCSYLNQSHNEPSSKGIFHKKKPEASNLLT